MKKTAKNKNKISEKKSKKITIKKAIPAIAIICIIAAAAVIFYISSDSTDESRTSAASTDTDTGSEPNVTEYGDTREYSDEGFGMSMTLPEGYSVGTVDNDSTVKFFESSDGNTKVNMLWHDNNFNAFIENRKAASDEDDENINYLVQESLEINGRKAYRETYIKYNPVVPEFGEAHYVYYIAAEENRFLMIDFCESNGRVTSLDYEAPFDSEFLQTVQTLSLEEIN